MSTIKRLRNRSVCFATATALSLTLAGPGQADEQAQLARLLPDNGFSTLKLALDITGLADELADLQVTLFAPTDDVFESTAQTLGCSDALDLAGRLQAIDLGGTDALTAVLLYHVHIGKLKTPRHLLQNGMLSTALNVDLESGVNAEGLYVMGLENSSPSTVTVEGLRGYGQTVYPINQILLPISPPANLCD